jgi:hypothetical protein
MDARGLAEILSQTLIGGMMEFESLLVPTLTKVIGTKIHSPEVAAAIEQCLYFNRRLIETYQTEAQDLVGIARSITNEDFDDVTSDEALAAKFNYEALGYRSYRPTFLRDLIEPEHDPANFYGLAEQVELLAKKDSLNELSILQEALRNDLALSDKFGFVRSESGLFVPANDRPRLVADFAELLKRASVDRAHLLSMSPRAFEEFMANLFDALGYRVELTPASRDWGVDLVCVKSLHGIPFKFAAQLKRYKEGNPITLEMVNSFVGANEMFQADKLVYITTSRYTKPALQFAERCSRHRLELRDYSHIQEWCIEAAKEPYQLLRITR